MNIAPDQKLHPEKITKPFQLLAAWLAGLILVNGSLLTAATLLKEPAWVAPMLAVAAIVNVPIFLVAIFLLQTKFRQQMQEDPFYSKYLENLNSKSPPSSTAEEITQVRLQVSTSQKETLEIIKSVQNQMEGLKNEVVAISKAAGQSAESEKRISQLEILLKQSAKNIEVVEKKMDWSSIEVQLNNLLPEFQNIKTSLISNGITIKSIFGSTSEEPEIPSTFVLGVTLDVPINELRQMIDLLRPFGLEAISINKQEIRRIYIGSYIYKKIQATRLDAGMLDVISKAKRTQDLIGIVASFSPREIS